MWVDSKDTRSMDMPDGKVRLHMAHCITNCSAASSAKAFPVQSLYSSESRGYLLASFEYGQDIAEASNIHDGISFHYQQVSLLPSLHCSHPVQNL